MKTLCIDARFWGIKDTGIGRYTENLIANFPKNTEVKLILLVSPETAKEPKLASFEKYIVRHHPYTLASFIEMHIALFKINPDLLHVPNLAVPVFWPGRIVITVHDLIKHYSKGLANTTRHPVIYWLKYFEYLILVYLAVHRARHIFVPAKYWQKKLIEIYHLSPAAITVTYEGVDKSITNSRVVQFKPPLSKPFLVYTGNVYPHKNIPFLINSVKTLNQSSNSHVGLAIVCARSVFTSRIEKIILATGTQQYVKFLGRLTDPQLADLYDQADAFVFPSLIEGFGLTGLEAMARKLPVISSNASCLPEIYGNAALYFDPRNSQDLVGKISQLLADNRLRQSLINKGLTQVKKYSWSKMAKETWAIYQTELR